MAEKTQIQLDACDATAGWSASRDAIAMTVDTSTKKEGTGSLNLGVDISASTDHWAEYDKTYSVTDLSRANLFKIWIYVDAAADLNKFTAITMDFYSDAGTTKYFNVTIEPNDLAAGWTHFEKSLVEFQQLGGTPTWETIQKVIIAVYGTEDITLGDIKIDDIRFVEDIEEQYDVSIDSQGYLLKEGSYNRNDMPYSQSRFSTGNFDYSSWHIWQYHPHTDWSGGFNQEQELNSNMFYTSEYVDVSDFGEIKMSKQRATVESQIVAATEVTAMQAYDGDLYVGLQKPGSSESYVYKWTGSGSTSLSNTLTGKAYITDMEIYDGKLQVATGIGNIVYNYNGSAWDNTNVKTVHYLQTWDDKMYACYKTLLYSYDGTSWTTEYDISEEYIGRMTVYRGKLYYLAHDDDILDAGAGNASKCCLMSYDGNVRTRILEFEETGRPDMITWNAKIWFIVGGKLWSYNGSNVVMELDITNLYGDYALGQYPDYREDWGTSLMISKGKLYAVFNASSTTSGLLCNGGSGWFPMLPAHTKRYTCLGTFDQGATAEDHLMLGDTDGSLFKMDEDTYDTAVTGVLESSWIDMGLFGIDKIFESIAVYTEPLPGDTSYKFLYKKDNDTSWSYISGAGNEGDTFQEASLPEGTYGKKIKYRLELTTTDATETPTINDVVIKYLPSPDAKRKWTMGILMIDNQILRDGTREEKSGNELADTLWTSRKKKQTVDFTDVDDSKYKVVINDMQVKGPYLQGERENPEYYAYIEIIEK